MRKVLSLLTVLMFVSVSVFAQLRDISGRVLDNNGDPVPLASITIKGKRTGVSADADGKFSIKAAENDVLVITSLGMQTKEVTVGKSNTLGITLTKNVKEEQTVLVTGAMGIKKSQRQQTTSIQVLTADQVNTTRQPNLVNALAGKVVGTQVRGQSGAKLDNSAELRVRGGSSIGGERGAIYVVDGTIVNSFDVNPDDIETVNVLKGANATVLFGQQAANGAVVITTRKKANQKKGIGVEVNQSLTFDNVLIIPKYQNRYAGGGQGNLSTFSYSPGMPTEWQALDGKLIRDFTDDASWGPEMLGQEYIPWYALIPGHSRSGQTARLTPQPSNINDFWETGVTNNFNVSLAKSTDVGNTRLSYTNQHIKGLIPNSKSNRHTVFLTNQTDLSKYVTFNVNATYTYNQIQGDFSDGYANNSAGNFNQWMHRDLDMKIMKELRGLRTPIGTVASWNFRNNPDAYSPASPGNFWRANYWYNPYAFQDNLSNIQNRDRLFGDVGLTFKPFRGFTIRGTVRKNQLTTNYEFITKSLLEESGAQTGTLASYSEGQTTRQEHNYEVIANYRKKIKDFDVDVLGGGTVQRINNNTSLLATTNGLNIPDLYAISNSKAAPAFGNDRTKTRNRALFGTLDVSYKRLFNLNAGYRSDYYSTLSPGKNNLNSKSFGGGLFISEIAKVREAAPWLSYAKVYGSYGEKPLNPLGFAQEFLVYSLNPNSFGSNPLQSTPNTTIDPGLVPIIVTTKEYGLDLKFLNNRLGLNIVYYDELIDKEPASVRVSGTSGFTQFRSNVGKVERKGLEFETFAKLFANKAFNWDVNFNIAKILSNKVLDVDGDPTTNEQTIAVPGGAGSFGTRYARAFHVEGKDAGQLIGGGILRNADGVPILNPDGTFQSDVNRNWGSTIPKVTGGLFNTFSYKNFVLSVNIDYQFGGKFFSLSESWGTYSGLLEWTAGQNDRGKAMRDPVTLGGGVHVVGVAADGRTPVDRYVDAQTYFRQYYNNQIAEPFVHDLTFIKLREVSLGYTIPVGKIGIKWLQGAQFSVVARNPALLYRKSENFDPSEISGLYGEDGQLPGTRSMGVNLKLNF